jgi:hypothetical protein
VYRALCTSPCTTSPQRRPAARTVSTTRPANSSTPRRRLWHHSAVKQRVDRPAQRHLLRCSSSPRHPGRNLICRQTPRCWRIWTTSSAKQLGWTLAAAERFVRDLFPRALADTRPVTPTTRRPGTARDSVRDQPSRAQRERCWLARLHDRQRPFSSVVAQTGPPPNDCDRRLQPQRAASARRPRSARVCKPSRALPLRVSRTTSDWPPLVGRPHM